MDYILKITFNSTLGTFNGMDQAADANLVVSK